MSLPFKFELNVIFEAGNGVFVRFLHFTEQVDLGTLHGILNDNKGTSVMQYLSRVCHAILCQVQLDESNKRTTSRIGFVT